MGSRKSPSRKGLAMALGVLSTFWLSTVPFILTPAMNRLGEYYSAVPYSRVLILSTVVALMVVPFSLLSGAVVGRKVGYRPMLLASIVLMLVGGMAPYLFPDRFWPVMACRVVCGVGVGLSYPLCNALVARLYDGETQGRMMGAAMMSMNLSGMLYQSVSGAACAADVRNVWLVHGVLLVPLVLVFFFLPEPEREGTAEPGALERPADSFFSMRVVVISFACCLLYILVNTVILNVSAVLAVRNLGDSAAAGMVSSTYAVGGLLSSLLYNRMYRGMGRWMVPFSLAMLCLGTACCGFGGSLALMVASEMCIGFATYLLWPGCCSDFAAMVSPDRLPLANGVISALWNLGVFLSAPYMGVVSGLTGDASPVTAVRVTLWLMLALSAVWTVARLRRPAKYERAK